jgi:Putative MetA-pathway of phenol degradation
MYASLAYSMDLVGPGGDSIGQQQSRSHLDMAVPLFHLNYGITDRIQGRIAGAIPLTTVAPDNGNLAVGFGDLSAGFKYRFMDQTNGLEYDDACNPRQSEDPYGLQGPVSVSVFPQFTFPTGSVNRGLGDGEYELAIPVDVAREIGKLYLVGEVDFIWLYHDHLGANEVQAGIAAFYAVNSKWNIVSEQRLDSATSGRGPSLWLMDIGAVYQLNQRVMVFGAIGTTVAATSTVAPTNAATIIGGRTVLW